MRLTFDPLRERRHWAVWLIVLLAGPLELRGEIVSLNGAGDLIVDGSTTDYFLQSTDERLIVDVTVTIHGLVHDAAGSLQFHLINTGPGSDTRFVSAPGGSGDTTDFDGDYTFNDAFEGNMWSVAAGLGGDETIPPGDYYPFRTSSTRSSLLEVLGQPASGLWQLRVVDIANGTADGVFASWTLQFDVAGPAAPVLYVDADAPADGDGLSWATAYRDLRPAEVLAAYGGGVVTDVRVAAGTYIPTLRFGVGTVQAQGSSSPRWATLELVDGVAYRGGYAGWGEPDPDLRDFVLYETVLTGDRFGNDTPGSGDDDPVRQDNLAHIVRATGVGPDAVLEGFTVRNANTTSSGPTETYGGGVLAEPGSPTILHCVFRDNWARDGAGGAFTFSSSPVIEHCTFIANTAGENAAGALALTMGSAVTGDPVITDCRFEANIAEDGGGAVRCGEGGTTIFTNCQFINNVVRSGAGGACRMAGGCGEHFINCDFVGNTADAGGAVHTDGASCAPVFEACLFSGNEALAFRGGAVGTQQGSGVVLTDCVFTDNFSATLGGAVDARSDAVLNGCRFESNQALEGGGGLAVNDAAPRITACQFLGNTAPRGAGVLLVDDAAELVNCRILGNAATIGGGVATDEDSIAQLVNCIVAANSATNGGGVAGDQNAVTTLINCTVAHNAASSGGGVWNDGNASAVLVNSVVWGHGPTPIVDDLGLTSASYSLIEEGWPGTGNLAVDPLFADPDGPDGDPQAAEDNDYRLADGSIAVDAGDNTAVPADGHDLDGDGDFTEAVPIDVAGLDRFIDNPRLEDAGIGSPPIVDMGAHEQLLDCNDNGVWDSIDIGNGTSVDCNDNGRPDSCDVAEGTSADCGGNGVPDECEDDCNCNGISDATDIADGTALDCNNNGRPDGCDLADGTSVDCGGDGVPDECVADCNCNGIGDADEITAGTPDCDGDGVPDECAIAADDGLDCNDNGVLDACEIADGASPDCNDNGRPDACDALFVVSSGPVAPLQAGPPTIVTFTTPPPALFEVRLRFRVVADLDAPDERVFFHLNGAFAQPLFGDTGSLCPARPDEAEVIIDAAMYNALLAGGDAVITVVTTNTVDAADCAKSWFEVILEYAADDVGDCNGNGQLDGCDVASGASADANGNDVPDECECLTDVTGDGRTGVDDLVEVILRWGTTDPAADVDGSGVVGVGDLVAVTVAWGPCR